MWIGNIFGLGCLSLCVCLGTACGADTKSLAGVTLIGKILGIHHARVMNIAIRGFTVALKPRPDVILKYQGPTKCLQYLEKNL